MSDTRAVQNYEHSLHIVAAYYTRCLCKRYHEIYFGEVYHAKKPNLSEMSKCKSINFYFEVEWQRQHTTVVSI